MTDTFRNRFLFPALLVAVVALLYGRTLTFDFVNYDDYDLVARNTGFLGDPANILTAFTTHAFTSHREEGVYYRPLLLVTYFADYAVWGVNPLGYHLTNLLLHSAASVLLFFLVIELLRQAGTASGGAPAKGAGEGKGGDALTAFLAALLFAVHPVQTESVAWVAGRNDILLGLLLIAALYCYVLQYGGPKPRRMMFPASAALFAAAVLTKESALFFLPLFPLYELGVRRESLATLFSGPKHMRVSVFLAIAVAYLGVRYNIFGAFIGAEKLYGNIPLDKRFLMAPGLALTNLLFLLWPVSLNIVHPIEKIPWFGWPAMLVALAASAGVVFVWVRTFRREPLLSWSVGWLVVGMVPLLNIFPLAVPVLEHRLYAASAGFAVAFVLAVSRLRLLPVSRNAAMPLLAAACFVLAGATWARVPVWTNSETLWLDSIQKEPDAARSYFNLAGYYFERRQFDRTIALLGEYVRLKPDDFNGYSKLRQTYYLAGRMRDAAAVCRTLIEKDPSAAARYLEAGVLFERMGLSDSVISVYREGLSADPSSAELHRRLGMWYRSAGDTAGAASELRAADSLAGRTRPPR
jgi:hypothetical protein